MNHLFKPVYLAQSPHKCLQRFTLPVFVIWWPSSIQRRPEKIHLRTTCVFVYESPLVIYTRKLPQRRRKQTTVNGFNLEQNTTTSVMETLQQQGLSWHSLEGPTIKHGAPLPIQKGKKQGKSKSCSEKTWMTFGSISTEEPQAKQAKVDYAEASDIPECNGVDTKGAELDDGTLSDSTKMDVQSHHRLLKNIAHYVGDESDVYCASSFTKVSQQMINATTVLEILEQNLLDPEVLLTNLGFGHYEADIKDKLPSRFIASASSASGITGDLVQKTMICRDSPESTIINSRFSKANRFANVVDTINNVSVHSSRKRNTNSGSQKLSTISGSRTLSTTSGSRTLSTTSGSRTLSTTSGSRTVSTTSGSRTLSTTSAWSRLSLAQPPSPSFQTEEKALEEGSKIESNRKQAFLRTAKEHFFSKTCYEENETEINQKDGFMEDIDHARAETQVECGNTGDEETPSGVEVDQSWIEQNMENGRQLLNIGEMSTKEEDEETGSVHEEDEREAMAADHSKRIFTQHDVVPEDQLRDTNLTNLDSSMNNIPHSDEAENPSPTLTEEPDVSTGNDIHDSPRAEQIANSEKTTISQEILRKPWGVDEETDTLNLNSRTPFEDPLSSNGSVNGQDQVQEQELEVRSQPSAGSLGNDESLNRPKLIRQIAGSWTAPPQRFSLERTVILSPELHSPIECSDEKATETPREDGPPPPSIPAFQKVFTSGHSPAIASAEVDGSPSQTPKIAVPPDVSNPYGDQGNAMPERIRGTRRNVLCYNPHLLHINQVIKKRCHVALKKTVCKETQTTNATSVVPSTKTLPATIGRSDLSENTNPQLASLFEQKKSRKKENVSFPKEVFPGDARLNRNAFSISVENSFGNDAQTSATSQEVMPAIDENFLKTRSLPSHKQLWDDDAFLDIKNIRNIPRFPLEQNHQECTRISKPPRGSCEAQETWITESPKTRHRRMHPECFNVPQNEQNHLHCPQSQVLEPRSADAAVSTSEVLGPRSAGVAVSTSEVLGPRSAGVAVSTTASRVTSMSTSRRSAKLNCLEMTAQDIVMTLKRLASWQSETLAIAKAMLRSTTRSHKINSEAWLVLLALEAGQKNLRELYGHLESICTGTRMCADDTQYLLVAIRRDLWKLQGQLKVVCADLKQSLEFGISKGNKIRGRGEKEQSCLSTFQSLSFGQHSSRAHHDTPLLYPNEEYDDGKMTRGFEE
uniref:uncharacterized protein n=1 Tax=Myxine glutinosa TaxID=7769 RepID=UPI00358FAED7